MSKDKIPTDNAGKTFTLIALGNTLLAPLYWIDSKIGLTTAIIATSAFLYKAHEVGKKRRTTENLLNNANTFFGGPLGDKSTDIHTTLANIAEGGSAIFDEIMPQDNSKRG
ncbi:MAG: hypothetical protein HYX60_02970 [Legionella longbeachae]|nr:hypothetical protein [Legionella longbeachae]